jgi:[protein-PII] uridylyltransferase
VTQDAFGLLYRIGRVLSSHDCNIEVALITTEGHRAIDVFYVTRGGSKLSADVEKTIEADLLQALPDS